MVGLTLAGAEGLMMAREARERIEEAADSLDDAIRAMRDLIFNRQYPDELTLTSDGAAILHGGGGSTGVVWACRSGSDSLAAEADGASGPAGRHESV